MHQNGNTKKHKYKYGKRKECCKKRKIECSPYLWCSYKCKSSLGQTKLWKIKS